MVEQAKTTPPTQEHPYPPVAPYAHQPYNGAGYPPPGPPGYPPPFFPYPPPPDGSHGETGHNGAPPAPYVMFGPPPGMMYAYPPPQQGQRKRTPIFWIQGTNDDFDVAYPPQPTSSAPSVTSRAKRKQVKMATVLRRASAVTKTALVTGARSTVSLTLVWMGRERKGKRESSGVPINAKTKEIPMVLHRIQVWSFFQFVAGSNRLSGEWPAGSHPPTAATTAAALHAVTSYAHPPEGYYPVFYPPGGAFMPQPPHDGQPNPDGSPPHAAQPPMMPYYLHPAAYPPFHPYPPMYPPPPPGAQQHPIHQQPAPPPEQQQPPQTINPTEAGKKPDDLPNNGVTSGGEGAPTQTRKRPRASKTGEPRAKKSKTVTATSAKDGESEIAAAGVEEDGGAAAAATAA